MKIMRQIWLYRWPAACAFSLLLLLNVVWRTALPAWAEYAALRQQTLNQEQETSRYRDFAKRHGDYESYIALQERELADAQGRLRAAGDINAAQSAVQEAAQANGVLLAEMSAAGASPKANGALAAYQEYRLRLQAEGDYYAVLRWLRQLERQGLSVGELRLLGDGESGRVHAEILLRTCGDERT